MFHRGCLQYLPSFGSTATDVCNDGVVFGFDTAPCKPLSVASICTLVKFLCNLLAYTASVVWRGWVGRDRYTGNSVHRRHNFPIKSSKIDSSCFLLSTVDTVLSRGCIRTKRPFEQRPLQPQQAFGREIGLNYRSGLKHRIGRSLR